MLIPEIEAGKVMCVERSTSTTKVMCIGKKCCSWRWFDLRMGESSRTNGYCGRAGVPRVLEVERNLEV